MHPISQASQATSTGRGLGVDVAAAVDVGEGGRQPSKEPHHRPRSEGAS